MSETLQLTVTGMTCSGCEHVVKTSLTRVTGVEEVNASFKGHVVDVTYDETKVTPAVIRTTIEGLGYEVA